MNVMLLSVSECVSIALDSIWVYILVNLKDLINICFWIFTGIIAFVTYKNAKKTLFNPIRSETVKYQMKIITDFIDKYTSKGYSFEIAIDYSNLLKLNLDTDYTFYVLNSEPDFEKHLLNEVEIKRLKFCKENLGGFFEIRLDNEKLNLEIVHGDFETAKQYIQTTYIKDKEAKYKNLVLQRIYLTYRFCDFYTDLVNLQTNPFIPNDIKNEIESITKNIYFNIGELYKLLNKYVTEQSGGTYQDVFSQFERRKIDHKSDLESLRNMISIYFKVNGYK